MKNSSKMETRRETKGRKLQTETVFRPRDERSPFICHLSFAFDSPVSPPLLFPRAGIVLSSTRIPKERSALVRDPDRSFWRENRCNTRKRFGQFNPLKRMARRSIEERKLEQGRGNGQHLFRNHPLPPPPLFFPLSPILPTFFYHPPLSFFTREGEFLFSFPTIKPNAKDPFLLHVCNTLLPPSRSRIVFRNERNFPFVEHSCR